MLCVNALYEMEIFLFLFFRVRVEREREKDKDICGSKQTEYRISMEYLI